jgi:penicillin-binding protein 1A
MTRAYGVFSAKGVLFDSVFVTKIKDRYGKVLYDYEAEKVGKGQQVISDSSAFVMANMMKGVVDHGTGYRVKELGRPVAGKTGTSNDQMDTWFIGYTPSWVCGVWVGFDQKKQIGAKETGGVVSAPIWLYFMRDFLKYQEESQMASAEQEAKAEAERLGIKYQPPEVADQRDFIIPEGVEPFWVDKSSGRRASEGAGGAMLEYFIKGTEPESGSLAEEEYGQSGEEYLEAPDL